MHIYYSWDVNCIRIISRKGNVECVPLTLGGRNLKPHELLEAAQNHWNQISHERNWVLRDITGSKFTYLKRGEGYGPESE